MSATSTAELVDHDRWQACADRLVETHGVPGTSVAIAHGGEMVAVAAGVLNIETGVTATTDSMFQIGSTTKAFTAALIMQLVESGTLSLDEPIRRYVPEFRVADPKVTERATLRHLLTHTSGLDGDHFVDTGRGDDALARYLESCSELEQAVPLGDTFSYCNSGYAIAGRVVERVTGSTWDSALREHVFTPLGLERTATLPEEALRYRVAHGHVPDGTGGLELAPHWATMRSMGPAGGIVSTASDVLRFAVSMLHPSAAESKGAGWLSPRDVALMHRPQVDVPDPSIAHHWGIGLMIQDWGGTAVVGHDGGTIGQSCLMRWVPTHDLAVVVMCNSSDSGAVFDDVLHTLAADVGVAPPPDLAPSVGGVPDNADDWIGTYRRVNFELTVERRGEALHGVATIGGLASDAHNISTVQTPLLPARADTYVGHLLPSQEWTPVAFFQLGDGSRYVHIGGRAQRRVDG